MQLTHSRLSGDEKLYPWTDEHHLLHSLVFLFASTGQDLNSQKYRVTEQAVCVWVMSKLTYWYIHDVYVWKGTRLSPTFVVIVRGESRGTRLTFSCISGYVHQMSSLFYIRLVYMHTQLTLTMEGSPASKYRIVCAIQVELVLAWSTHSHPMLHVHMYFTDNTHLNNFNWAGRQLSEWQVRERKYEKQANHETHQVYWIWASFTDKTKHENKKQHKRCTMTTWGEPNRNVRQV